MRYLSFLLGFFLILIFPSNIFALENRFINVVIPVRVSSYVKDLGKNLIFQEKVVDEQDLAATWLLTYDVLNNPDLVQILKSFSDRYEFGIFLEISPGLATDSEVFYHQSGSWHFANSVFLSGYSQEERKRLIDKVFEKFKDSFGTYPKAVGAWWVDSFSLKYMLDKYKITTSLGLADQFSTDGYQVWGGYFFPFYPSKYHSAMPALDLENKLDVVIVNWASRDPLNGYYHSFFSTQDYLQPPVNKDTAYFENLLRTYLFNQESFGHIVVGLESDLSPEVYENEFKRQLMVVKKLENEGVSVVTMSQFADWYRKKFPKLSPVFSLAVDDILGSGKQVFWFGSPYYRIGLSFDKITQKTKIFDLRSYHKNFQEPYFISANRDINLSIYIPSYFDEVNNSEDVWVLNLGDLKAIERGEGFLNLSFEKGEINLSNNYLDLSGIRDIPKILKINPNVKISVSRDRLKIAFSEDWIVGQDGFLFRDLTDIATHELLRKRNLLVIYTLLFFFFMFLIFIKERKKIYLSFLILPIFLFLWFRKNSMIYYVSQAEIEALLYLLPKPNAKVLVPFQECLGCSWTSREKPAVFSNKRNYVGFWSGKSVVSSSSFFQSDSAEFMREELNRLNVGYIYLAKYDDYKENLKFSPGDLGIRKIYSNANAEIWQVLKKSF